MDLYEFDSQIKDGIWTWMELLANSVAGCGKEWGTKFADQHHGERKQVSAVGRLLGKGAPKDEVRKFRLAYTSLMIHEVVIRSADFCPDDPEAFQERFSMAVFKLVDPELRDNLLHVYNKNIEDHHRFLSGEIDQSMYITRLSGRFFGKDLERMFTVSVSYPGIVKFVDALVEAIDQADT